MIILVSKEAGIIWDFTKCHAIMWGHGQFSHRSGQADHPRISLVTNFSANILQIRYVGVEGIVMFTAIRRRHWVTLINDVFN